MANRIWTKRSSKMTKILVVDDEEDMLILIKNIFKKRNYTVDIYENPLFVDESNLSSYNLIILDIMMPNIDGISFCKKIRDKVDCPIIFLTAKTMESDLVEGLASGGDDYITKPFGVDELLARVEAHLRREKREKHSSLMLDDIRIDLSSRQIYSKGKILPFTKSEYEICELLARRKGQVFSRDQIYEIIFGYDGKGDSSAISEHIKNIRSKFKKYDVMPIETVWGIGYKWK